MDIFCQKIGYWILVSNLFLQKRARICKMSDEKWVFDRSYCNLHAAQKGIQCHNIKESSLLQCKCLIKAQKSIKSHLWSVNFFEKNR